MMEATIKYFKDSKDEMKKIAWPTKQQVINHTMMVIAISIFIAAVIGALDFGFQEGIKTILQK